MACFDPPEPALSSFVVVQSPSPQVVVLPQPPLAFPPQSAEFPHCFSSVPQPDLLFFPQPPLPQSSPAWCPPHELVFLPDWFWVLAGALVLAGERDELLA